MTGSETKRTVTRLSFENHTACECVGRNSDLMPRTEPYDPVVDRLQESRLSSLLLYNHDESSNNSEGKSSRHHENLNKKNKTTKKGQQQDGRHDDSSLQLGRVATAYSPDPNLLFQQQQQQSNEDSTAPAKPPFDGASLSSSHSNPKSFNYSK